MMQPSLSPLALRSAAKWPAKYELIAGARNCTAGKKLYLISILGSELAQYGFSAASSHAAMVARDPLRTCAKHQKQGAGSEARRERELAARS